MFDYDADYFLDAVCEDSRDLAILEALRQAGPTGLLPKLVASR